MRSLLEKNFFKKDQLSELEALWFHRIARDSLRGMKRSDPLDEHDRNELAWMGLSRIPVARANALLRGLDPEDWWTKVLEKFFAKEYSQIKELAAMGEAAVRNFRPLTPSVLTAKPTKKFMADATASIPEVLRASAESEDIGPAKTAYVAVLAFQDLSDARKAALLALGKDAPSAQWWKAVSDLVKSKIEGMRVARKEQLSKEQRIQKNYQDMCKVASAAQIPKYDTSAFQDFVKRIVLDPDVAPGGKRVYPDYLALPAHVDVEAELSTSADSAGTGKYKNGCAVGTQESSSLQLQVQQAIVNAMLVLRAKGRIDSPGLLVWHSTGAGKTLLSLCALVAFWNVTTPGPYPRPVPIFMVSVKSNNNDNGPEKLARLGCKFFPGFRAYDGTMPFAGGEAEAAKSIVARLRSALLAAAATPKKRDLVKSRGRCMYTFQTLGKDLQDRVFKTDNNSTTTKARSRIQHALFVIDEAHYMNAPYNRGDSLSTYYGLVRRAMAEGRDPANTWCMAMTATPGTTRDELWTLMQAVTANPKLPNPSSSSSKAVVAGFLKGARGAVSYAQLYGDYSHFARMKPVEVRVNMQAVSPLYSRMYTRMMCKLSTFRDENPASCPSSGNKKEQDEPADKTNKRGGKKKPVPPPKKKKAPTPLDLDPHKRTMFLRAVANYISVNVSSGGGGGQTEPSDNDEDEEEGVSIAREFFFKDSDSDMLSGDDYDDDDDDDGEGTTRKRRRRSGGKSRSAVVTTQDGRGTYKIFPSPKVVQVVKSILRQKRSKHYVYSADKFTIGVIAHMLMVHGGFKPAHDPAEVVSSGAGPRFLLLDQLTSKKSHVQPLTFRRRDDRKPLAGEALASRINACKDVFNADNNVDGSRVQVVLATADHFKGVDLNHLRHLHLVDSMPDYQDFLQFVGRGSRYCSHAGLPMPSRVVNLFFYRQTDSGALNPKYEFDVPTWKASLEAYKSKWGDMEKKMQEVSVDFGVFEGNVHKNSREIQRSLQEPEVVRVPADPRPARNNNNKRGEAAEGAKVDREARKAQMRIKAQRQKALLAMRAAERTKLMKKKLFRTALPSDVMFDMVELLKKFVRDSRAVVSRKDAVAFVTRMVKDSRRSDERVREALGVTASGIKKAVDEVVDEVFHHHHPPGPST